MEPFHASASPPISKTVGELPNKRFGSKPEGSETNANLKEAKQPLSTSKGHCPKAGKDDISKVGTMAPLEAPDFIRGNRPNDWPPSHVKR
jgi:hypothetical protein